MTIPINLKLRQDIRKRFTNLESRSDIAKANKVSRQRISQLVDKMFSKKTIDQIDTERHLMTMRKYKIQKDDKAL